MDFAGFFRAVFELIGKHASVVCLGLSVSRTAVI